MNFITKFLITRNSLVLVLLRCFFCEAIPFFTDNAPLNYNLLICTAFVTFTSLIVGQFNRVGHCWIAS